MIQETTVEAIEQAPNLREILDAYASESSISGMPPYDAQMANYKQLEAAGILHVFAAYAGDRLIGLLVLIVSFLPHYNAKVATTESFFVDRAHRKTGAGMALLRTAEARAAELGAVGLFISAPRDGRLAKVMQAMPSYTETSRVFFRSLAHV